MVHDNNTVNPAPDMDRRSFLKVAAGTVVSGALLAESAVSVAAASSPASKGVIGLSLNGLVEYDQGVATGVMKALEGTGYGFTALQAGFDVSKELTNIQSLIAKQVKGLAILPVTIESAGRGARLAKAAGIPSVNLLFNGDPSDREYFIGASLVQSKLGGRMIGEWLKQNVPSGGKFCVIQGVVGQGFSEKIDAGLDAALRGSNFHLVLRQPGNFDRSQAITITQNVLKAHPDLKVIVDYAATMGDGIAEYLQGIHRPDIVHVTSDADQEMLHWIKTPYLRATRYYSSADTGLKATQQLVTYLEAGHVAHNGVAFVPQSMRTKSNIASAPPFIYNKYKTRASHI